MIEASFAMFLLLFVGVGLASAIRAKKSRNDYYLASREIKPWLAGLSAVATNNSGYMFIRRYRFHLYGPVRTQHC